MNYHNNGIKESAEVTPTSSATDTHLALDSIPAPKETFFLAIQHVCAAYAGIIAPPLIIGKALDLPLAYLTILLSTSILASGAVTLLQTIGIPGIGVKLPLVEGVSFSTIAPMLIIGQMSPDPFTAMQIIMGSVIISSVFMFFGASLYARLLNFFPPLVLGSVVTVIGLTLIPVSIEWMQGQESTPFYQSPYIISLSFFTFMITIMAVRYGPKFVKRVSVLLGITTGTLIAIPMGLVDFSEAMTQDLFVLPHFLAFGMPKFEITSIISMTIVMWVIMIEATCNIMAIGEIVGKDIKKQDVINCLRADCLGSIFSAVLNGFQCSAYGQNIGIIQISRVYSRYVVAVAGLLLVILGMFPLLSAMIASIPLPVLGGACLAVFGLVVATGIQTLSSVDLTSEQGTVNSLIIAASITMGMVPLVAPQFYTHFPHWVSIIFGSGITSSAITAIRLNLILNEAPKIHRIRH
ncbi:nucleobase:cation symporter-2 family protein [Candidatus Nitrosacidococcus sp. I8]|uniref:nucleobase:cation symporter-2 family protein n=1 Tax=Candidatus Nitrosacidococcus sp. I8 TaxID=2942908 RepID=UPI002225ECEE|nr:nucleobase:cation symporter-2 family protein [Candidatus Nitrosacidococcus sp. I8]CAH9018604.1 Nucleobase transporter PlUacP [Candidatus Nitrosacidococcus sp. I8]